MTVGRSWWLQQCIVIDWPGRQSQLARWQHKPPPTVNTMASQESTTAAKVQAQFTPAHNAQRACRHCGAVLSAPCRSSLKQHLASCKSLPDSVRAVLDHAAVCESRAGLGCYGGVHASVYRGFRVTGWGVNECRGCGKVVRGWGANLKQHKDHSCSGMAVTWPTLDVGRQFEKVDGDDGGTGGKCRHCGYHVQSLYSLKLHLARCKSLPDSVRAVLDHAAVCESRAGLGRYGGVHAAVYRGFRVTGWGVNECRGCGKVVRGWQLELRQHIKRKGCMASSPITAGAVTAGGALHTGNVDSRSISSGGAAAIDGASTTPSCSTRGTKRQRPLDVGTSNVCDDNGDDVHTSWPHRPTMPRCGGGRSGGGNSNSRGLQRAQQQGTRQRRSMGVTRSAPACSHARDGGDGATAEPSTTVNGDVAWAHGFTVTGSGLRVPLAPMPSRCKRARRMRGPVGVASTTSNGDVGGCDGPVSSRSGAAAV